MELQELSKHNGGDKLDDNDIDDDSPEELIPKQHGSHHSISRA